MFEEMLIDEMSDTEVLRQLLKETKRAHKTLTTVRDGVMVILLILIGVCVLFFLIA